MLKIWLYNKACYIVELPTGEVYLLETGMPDEGDRVLAHFVKHYLKRSKIEGAILSHYHFNGHMGGTATLIDAMRGRLKIYHNNVFSTGNPDTTYPADVIWTNAMWRKVNEWDVPTEIVKAGDSIEHGDVKIEFISPLEHHAYPNKTETDRPNDESNVLTKISYGGFSFLFTGDMSRDGMQELADNNPNDVTVMHIPHHGDRNYINEEIMAAFNPDLSLLEFDRNGSKDWFDNSNYDYHMFRGTLANRGIPLLISVDANGNYTLDETTPTEDEIERDKVYWWNNPVNWIK